MIKKLLIGGGAMLGVSIFLAIIGSNVEPQTPQVEQAPRVVDVAPATTTEAVATTTLAEERIVAPVASSPTPTPATKIVAPTAPPTPVTQPATSQFIYYSVTDVVDGDTIKISMNGTIETLRLIGMDTPETVDPRKPVQCFGKEASNKAKELLSNKKVRIEKDPTQGDLDKYGRTLAYIYREDGLFYNKYMIAEGFAHEYTYNTPYKYQSEFKAAQKTAEQNQLGLWSPNTCSGDTTTSAVSQTQPAPTPTNPSTGKMYYTSSYYSAKYYYPENCSGWETLSKTYLKSFSSVEALLAAYPSRTLNPSCQ